ncbi:MAG: alpha/beta fold hydrolase [Hyphomicrobiales bacterium]
MVGDGQLVPTADNPVPPTSVSGYFDGLDLARIRYARWEADEDALSAMGSCGTVCIFTGRGEFIEKYFETIQDLRLRGYDVAIMDWRGHGRSARPLGNPRKGHITTFEQYHGDLVNFMRDVVLPDCRPPYFALAHSMGGAILLSSAARLQPWFKRMVLTAPMLQLAHRWLSTKAMRRLSEIACYGGLGALFIPGGGSSSLETLPFSGNNLTSDQKRFVRNSGILKAARELGIGSPTFGWVHAAGQAMEALSDPEFPSKVHTPVLMIAAGQDTVVSNRAIDLLGRDLRGGGSLVIDGARHEILMERDRYRELFWAAFDAFVPGGDDIERVISRRNTY